MTTTTQLLASRDNPDDVALATGCIEWHGTHCAMCTTGVLCGAAAENLAFLEGTDLYETAVAQVPAQRRTGTTTGGTGASRRAYPASPKQKRYLESMLAERDASTATALQASVLTRAAAALKAETLTSRQASDALDILTDLPRRAVVTARRAAALTQARPVSATVEPGMYQDGERILKVYQGRQSGRLLVKVLVVDEDGPRFDYLGAAARVLSATAVRMTLEEAKAFGRRTKVCCQCGTELFKRESIEAGIGPICASKF
jgi:hypothetical protein